MKIGFIGVGNMAGAVINGLLRNNDFQSQLLLYDVLTEKTERFSHEATVVVCSSAQQVAEGAEVLILAVKPNILPGVMGELKEQLVSRSLLVVSLAVGKTLSFLEESLSPELPLARVMPNINAQVGFSTTGVACNSNVTQKQKQVLAVVFEGIGTLTEVPETQFHVFAAIAASAPAFAYLYINSVALAAQKAGMPKAEALRIASETVMGSAMMVLGAGRHPEELIDLVCSPGGTTIEGIAALKSAGFESAVIGAVDAVLAKDARLQGK